MEVKYSQELWVWVFLLFDLIGFFIFLYFFLIAISSKFWPSVAGYIKNSSILEFELNNPKRKRDNSYRLKIEYEYDVDRVAYVSSKLGFFNLSTNLKSLLEKKLEQYPAGKKVKVFYKKSCPNISVLEPGIGVGFVAVFVFFIFSLSTLFAIAFGFLT